MARANFISRKIFRTNERMCIFSICHASRNVVTFTADFIKSGSSRAGYFSSLRINDCCKYILICYSLTFAYFTFLSPIFLKIFLLSTSYLYSRIARIVEYLFKESYFSLNVKWIFLAFITFSPTFLITFQFPSWFAIILHFTHFHDYSD